MLVKRRCANTGDVRVPGSPGPLALETVLGLCRAVAVFLGPHGMESWPLREKWLALERRTRPQGFPVIPVLLSGGEPVLEFLFPNTRGDLCTDPNDTMALELLLLAA